MPEDETDLAVINYGDHIYSAIPATTPLYRFLELWLENRPISTQETYASDVSRFLLMLPENAPLQKVTLDDLSRFASSLEYLKESSKSRILNALKSMFSFGYSTGYLPANVGAAIRLRKIKRHLAERILSEDEILAVIRMEPNPRNHALLRFMYSSGARVSEVTKLTWRDVRDRESGRGQVTLDGKGDKERAVLLPDRVYAEIKTLQTETTRDDEPVFRSRKSSKDGHLDRKQIHYIVKNAAVRANVQTYAYVQIRTNIKTNQVETKEVQMSRVSPHFFRHAHISHALDRKVPAHVVQATVGHSSLATTTYYAHVRPDTSSALELPA